MTDRLLAFVSQYGTPALFVIAVIASVGIPLPVTLLLIVAGSMVAQGAMNMAWAVTMAALGATVGDQAGYAVGRWGGPRLTARFARGRGERTRIERLEHKAVEWGAAGIFLTRWLLTPLGTPTNLASGAAKYPWGRFLIWDALGELTGAALYIWLGRFFSDRVMALDAVLGDFSAALLALALAAALGWLLFSQIRRARRSMR